MLLPFEFDFKTPDYNKVFKHRIECLRKVEKNPEVGEALMGYYRQGNIAQMITDWGCTYDPRNQERSLPSAIPFILFDKQIECVNFIYDCWKNQESGVVDKSRDMGISELTVGFAVCMCLLYDGFSVGFGSKRRDYVDNRGDPKALLYKARRFLSLLPGFIRGNWDERKHSAFMRIQIPKTNSLITGDSGDQCGRGDRKGIYFPDEFAFMEHQETIDAALLATTNCKIYVSTPNGPNVLFCKKATDGRLKKIIMNWRDDPRKNEAWYRKIEAEIDNEVILNREYNNDHFGSLDGTLIKREWIDACIDAHIKLGIVIDDDAQKKSSLDLSDQGGDKNAWTLSRGILLTYVEEWTGVGSDPFQTTKKAFDLCDLHDCDQMIFDSSMIGLSVKGHSKVLHIERAIEGKRKIEIIPFLGGAGVQNPDKCPYRVASYSDTSNMHKKTNKELFLNLKAQSWWSFRRGVELTYNAIMHKTSFKPDEIISISSGINHLSKLKNELTQVTIKEVSGGKMMINKMPEGCASPNIADSAVMLYAPLKIRGGFFVNYPV